MHALKNFITNKKRSAQRGDAGNEVKGAQPRTPPKDLKEDELERLKRLKEHLNVPSRKRPRAEVGGEEESPTKKVLSEAPIELPPPVEVSRRLRKLGQPIKLFAERPEETYARWQKASKAGAVAAAAASSSTLIEPKVIERLHDEDKEAIAAGKTVSDIPRDLPAREKIKLFVGRLLRKWKQELEARPEEVKSSPEGRNSTDLFRTTAQDLGPLVKRLQHADLEQEVEEKVAAIVDFCIQKEYVRAHDKYIELAIGNAAWPMGVTMVGIHERVGRSKIFTSEIAHILNDETTRKYIQTIKRLMTLCQEWYPTDDPSQMVSIATATAAAQHKAAEAVAAAQSSWSARSEGSQ